jgi:hypothetical protein
VGLEQIHVAVRVSDDLWCKLKVVVVIIIIIIIIIKSV